MAKHDCVECSEGKHSACNGTAYVDFGDDLLLAEEECNCADRRHGEPTIADGFLATAQALGLSPRQRREGIDLLREADDRLGPDSTGPDA